MTRDDYQVNNKHQLISPSRDRDIVLLHFIYSPK